MRLVFFTTTILSIYAHGPLHRTPYTSATGNPPTERQPQPAKEAPLKVNELPDSASNSRCGALSGPGECSLTDDVFLKTTLIEIGIHPAASLGSQSPVPTEYGYSFSDHCSGDCRLGFICDYDSDGLSTGYPPYSGDYFVPGTPLEGWVLQYATLDGTYRYVNKGLVGKWDIMPDSIRITSDDTTHQQSVWEGHTPHARVSVTTTIPYGKQVFHVDTCVTNTDSLALANLYFMRNVDPDQTWNWNFDHTTYNYVKYQPEQFGYPGYVNSNDSTVALVIARGIEGYEKFVLAMGATDTRAFATHGGFDNDDPEFYYDVDSEWQGFGGSDVQLGDISRMRREDEGIQVTFKENVMNPGDTACFRTFFGLAAEFETQIPEPTFTPTPTPVPVCVDHDDAISCEIVGKLGKCGDKAVVDIWGTTMPIRELCPLQCGCCFQNDQCTCNDDEGLRDHAKRFQIWVPSCEFALRYVGCDHRLAAPYLKKYCPCYCPREFVPDLPVAF